MGNGGSQSVGCNQLSSLTSCLQGFDDYFIANSTCTWRFARRYFNTTNVEFIPLQRIIATLFSDLTDSINLGGCVPEPDCHEYLIDPNKVFQNDIIANDWYLLSATSKCLNIYKYRIVITPLLLAACAIFLLTFIRPCGKCYRLVSRGEAADGKQKAFRRRNQLKCRGILSTVVSLVIMMLMVIYAIAVSFSDSENIGLLPLLAILILGIENLFVMSVIREKFVRSWIDNERDRWSKLFLFLPAVIILSFELLFAAVCLSQLLSNLEIVAVQIIAWVDFVFTLNFTLISFIIRNPHLEYAPRKLELAVNIVWSVGLFILLLLMTARTCSVDHYSNNRVTYTDFEHCERKISGYAYTVAFLSIARAVCLSTLDRLVLFICPDRIERGHGGKKDDEDENEVLLIEGVDAFLLLHAKNLLAEQDHSKNTPTKGMQTPAKSEEDEDKAKVDDPADIKVEIPPQS